MGKFDDISKAVLKKFRKKEKAEKEEEQAPQMEDQSMNEGKKPAVYGINRKLVCAAFGVVVVAFISAFFFGIEGQKTLQEAKLPEDRVEPIKPFSNNHLPNDYASLSQYNDKRKPQPQEQKNAPDVQRQAPQAAGSAAPPIAQRSFAPYQMSAPYTYMQPAPAVQAPQEKAEKQEEKKNEFDAAIRFASSAQKSAQKEETSEEAPKAVSVAACTAPSATVVQAGTLIPAVLLSGINSELSGNAVAQVQSDVYDALTGTHLLIPAGSRLLGSYKAGATRGSSRIDVKWNALLLPDGSSYELGGRIVAVDGSGYTGLSGKVRRHTGEKIASGMLASGIGALASLAAGNTSASDTYTAGQLAAQGAASSLIESASSLFEKNADIGPTILIEPGYTFQLFVSEPIDFQV